MIHIKRSSRNPILKPDKEQAWEAEAVFNGCPVRKGAKIYLLYRAVSLPHYHAGAAQTMRISDIGIAESRDGFHFHSRRRFIIPEHAWERFGCEDPRVTKIDNTYFIFYTALSTYPFSPEGIKIGVAISKDLKKIHQKHLVTPFNAKAMVLFPEKINGKYCALLTANTDKPPARIAFARFDALADMWSRSFWDEWYKHLDRHALPLQRETEDQVEIGAVPIKTAHGWLVIYSYIRNYFSNNKIFGIEAVLLHAKDPSVIVARTDMPLMVPEEEYELYGVVPNVVFPSGALIDKNQLRIYYGAADSTCCVVSVNLQSMIRSMVLAELHRVAVRRSDKNPILTPNSNNSWESKAVFNPAAFYEKGKVHIVYRAMSQDDTSVFGYAASTDGIHIDERFSEPIYVPRERFEKKSQPGNSGCEDPRITKIGDTLYMCYTAFDGKHDPRVALTSISIKNFLERKWNWSPSILISPPNIADKDACIFPEKVKGKYLIFHRTGDDIDIDLVKNLQFDGETWLEERRWLKLRRGFWDSKKVGIAAPPVKTRSGWILLYHGVSDDNIYRVGAVLLDKKDPTVIIGRTTQPIFSPEAEYEKNGQVPNVVFPCGNIIIDKKLYIYYGGGDSVVGVARVDITLLLKVLR